MKVIEAKRLVLDGIFRDIRLASLSVEVDSTSPDPTDPGKFVIDGKPARVVHHYSGWHPHINLSWFSGSYDMPKIQSAEFYWYVFAIPSLGRLKSNHYLICDYLQVRDWVLEFAAPGGNTHQDHNDWRADIRVDRGLSDESQAYFRWGDEPSEEWLFPSRIVRLDNIAVVAQNELITSMGKRIGSYGIGGESEAHRRLKLYVAKKPDLLSLSSNAVSEIEHRFCTGDRVDVLFNNHGPLRTVVEVEIEGTENIIVGIHQAIKYRSLAAAESSLGILSPEVKAYVVSYGDGGVQSHQLARAYDVDLLTVDRRHVLAPAG
jgi:hypothetical protein